MEEVDHAELITLDGTDVRSRLLRISPAVSGRSESIVCKTKSEIVFRDGEAEAYEVQQVSLDQAVAAS